MSAPNAAARLRAALADRYRIAHELGAGGMATVYLAHDLRHERDVAIKVLHPELGGERFLNEWRSLGRCAGRHGSEYQVRRLPPMVRRLPVAHMNMRSSRFSRCPLLAAR